MLEELEVLYGYEGSATFENPFKRFLAAASLSCWNYFEVPIHLYLDKRAYRSIPISLRNLVTEIDILNWKYYRNLFRVNYFGFPKFVAMTRCKKAAIISDLDVVCFDFSWFKQDCNAATCFQDNFTSQAEYTRLQKVYPEYEGSTAAINGGFYYLRNEGLVRTVGRNLIHQCAVIERESIESDWWRTLDEGVVRACVRDCKEDFLLEDLQPYHFHVEKKVWAREEPFETWEEYMETTFTQFQEKLPPTVWDQVFPWVEDCRSCYEDENFRL